MNLLKSLLYTSVATSFFSANNFAAVASFQAPIKLANVELGPSNEASCSFTVAGTTSLPLKIALRFSESPLTIACFILSSKISCWSSCVTGESPLIPAALPNTPRTIFKSF